MILLSVSPVIYSVPLAFSTAELSTADPDEGRYYRWVTRAFGDFWGFLRKWGDDQKTVPRRGECFGQQVRMLEATHAPHDRRDAADVKEHVRPVQLLRRRRR